MPLVLWGAELLQTGGKMYEYKTWWSSKGHLHDYVKAFVKTIIKELEEMKQLIIRNQDRKTLKNWLGL